MSSSTNNQGTAQNSSSSLSSMVSTLVPVGITAAIYLIIFLILRRTQRRWYAPRTYIGTLRESERTPPLPSGFFNWFGAFWKIPDDYALQHQSLDAFLYLRFLRLSVALCFVGCLISWPVLFPVDATGGGNAQQLDIISYSNLDMSRSIGKYRAYAHVFVAWAFYGFVMYFIFRECIYYVNLRQAFLLSPLYSNRISSRTVLFTSVPPGYLNESILRKVFGPSVRNIWITGDTKQLDKLVQERDKVAYKLEGGQVKLIKAVHKERLASIKKGGAAAEERAAVNDAETGDVAARWLPKKKWPTNRTGKFGLIGRKVDTLTWGRSELERLIPEVEQAQASYRAGEFRKIPAVFIEFRTQGEAEAAFQVLAHHSALHMAPRYIGITPQDVIWSSLAIPWWQKVVRRYIVLAFICALIIFWAIPVAVVGVISNVTYLESISWLNWLSKIPNVIMGVVTGLLPAVALSILMSLVPIIIRLCARLSGEPSYSRVELFTQQWYFAFQVVQVFLITTFSSSASVVAKQIVDNPSSATTILAENLPKSSNFYIPYFIVQGLSVGSGVLAQVTGFVIFMLLYRYLAGTPRALYKKWTSLATISWGSTLPVYTNIVVIAICYAGIAPLMLGWATIGLGLLYLAWRYNVLFVTDTTIDTRGLIYPTALKQLFVGIYLAELCMIGLFASSTLYGPMVLMIAYLVFTVLFHISLNGALNPLLENLPQSLLAEEETLREDLEAANTGSHSATANNNGTGVPASGGTGHPGNAAASTNGHGKTGAVEPPALGAASNPKGNILTRFLKPWVYSDYRYFRGIVPQHEGLDPYNFYRDEAIERDAYLPPSVTSTPPLLWIPRDQAGVSRQEVAATSKVIGITDEGSELNGKGRIVWDEVESRPPLWEEKVVY